MKNKSVFWLFALLQLACLFVLGGIILVGFWFAPWKAGEVFQALETASMKIEPEQVSWAADHIAEFELPPGFSPGFALDVLSYQVVNFTHQDGLSLIFFVQFPLEVGLKPDQIQVIVQQVLAVQNRHNGRDLKTTTRRKAVVRGQEITITEAEGTDADRQPYRVQYGLFQGQSGPVMVVFSRPLASWNYDEVNAFLGSIR